MTTRKRGHCVGNDPLCPCHDGDACHYVAVGGTPAFKPKRGQPKEEKYEI